MAKSCRNCKGAQSDGDQRDDWDGTRAQNSSVAEEERSTALRASRAQQTLPRNLEKTESAEAGETLIKMQESAETGNAPKKTQSKPFNWSSIAKQENPETVLTSFFRDLDAIPADQLDLAEAERTRWIEWWKNLRMWTLLVEHWSQRRSWRES